MIAGSVDAALEQYPALAGDEAEDIEVVAREAFSILGVFGHAKAAAAVGAWRLARNPDDQIQAYLLQAVSGASVDRAPAAYVEAHFDGFADNFDHQLVDLLNYRAPERMAQLVPPTRPSSPRSSTWAAAPAFRRRPSPRLAGG